MISQSVCLIIHVDGYVVNGSFQCRELAYSFPERCFEPRSIHFEIEMPGTPLEEAAAENAFQQHGLPVLNMSKAFTQDMFPFFIRDLYAAHKTKKKRLVAFRGADTLAILKGLKIPCIDLESLGCPAYDDLPKDIGLTCGSHYRFLRCAKSIVGAYKMWIDRGV